MVPMAEQSSLVCVLQVGSRLYFSPGGQRLDLLPLTPVRCTDICFLCVLRCEEGWVPGTEGQYQFVPSLSLQLDLLTPEWLFLAVTLVLTQV